MKIPICTTESAPERARPTLEAVRGRFGFLPNLMGAMANSPGLLQAYLTLQSLFDETSLTLVERQTVLLETSVANGCEYCVAAHSAIARHQGVPAEVVDAIRHERAIQDPRLEALRGLTRELVATRGWPSEGARQRFADAGFTAGQLLEVVLGIGLKTLSNFTNHLAETPLDPAFAATAWHPSTEKNPSRGLSRE